MVATKRTANRIYNMFRYRSYYASLIDQFNSELMKKRPTSQRKRDSFVTTARRLINLQSQIKTCRMERTIAVLRRYAQLRQVTELHARLVLSFLT